MFRLEFTIFNSLIKVNMMMEQVQLAEPDTGLNLTAD